MDINHAEFVNILLDGDIAVYPLTNTEDDAIMVISLDDSSYRVPPAMFPFQKDSGWVSTKISQAVNRKNHDGETVLLSLLNSQEDFSHALLNFMLDLGADVNAPGRYGQTPLMAAINSRKFQVVKTLLEAGANVNDPDLYGRTPMLKVLDHWRSNDVKNVVYLLLDHGAILKSEIHFAITRCLHNVVDILIHSGKAIPRREYLFSNKVSHVDASVPTVLKSTPLTPLFTSITMNNSVLVKKILRMDFLNKIDLYPSSSFLKTVIDHLKTKDSYSMETVDTVQKVYSQPWSLWTLAFVSVSERIGFDSKREQNLRQSGLPLPLTQLLMFKDINS